MPVEVWTRIMKPAHQGVAIASLPGLAGGPRTAGLLPSFSVPWNGSTPATPSREANAKPAGGGMDSWLLDRLFGRR
jgi:penicillin-binding protein 1A